jgi:hypothetical protein
MKCFLLPTKGAGTLNTSLHEHQGWSTEIRTLSIRHGLKQKNVEDNRNNFINKPNHLKAIIFLKSNIRFALKLAIKIVKPYTNRSTTFFVHFVHIA